MNSRGNSTKPSPTSSAPLLLCQQCHLRWSSVRLLSPEVDLAAAVSRSRPCFFLLALNSGDSRFLTRDSAAAAAAKISVDDAATANRFPTTASTSTTPSPVVFCPAAASRTRPLLFRLAVDSSDVGALTCNSDDDDGIRFGSNKVIRIITYAFFQFFDQPWITWRHVPRENRDNMFEIFRGYYLWDESEETTIRMAFESVLASRFRGIMKAARNASIALARTAGHEISSIEPNYAVLYSYNPHQFTPILWQGLCDKWENERWRSLCVISRSNRNSQSSSGSISYYTGGSISTDEHQYRMTKDLGRMATWTKVYSTTRLKKSSRELLTSGQSDGCTLEWVNDKSKRVYETYVSAMKEKFGDDPTQHLPGDPEVWEKSVGGRKKGRLFRIGCSDLHYSVTGKTVQRIESYT